jgi:type IV pilus assembly protein PilO
MNELITKLLRLKAPLKAAIAAGVLVVMAGVYYFLFYSDLASEIASAQNGQTALKTERTSYETRKREYVAYRDELRKLQEEQRELLKALPKKAEIPSFISSVQEQAELSGLDVVNLNIDGESPEELYVKIPVRMEVKGTFNALTKFFKNVSELRRIVNIEGLGLNVERSETDTGEPKLHVKFVAATFRYIEKAGGT